MYMIMFSSAASCCLFLIFGKLNVKFSLWMAIYSGIGVLFGMYYMGKIMKKYKRPSLVSVVLSISLCIATGFSAYTNIMMLIKQKAAGLDIYSGEDIC